MFCFSFIRPQTAAVALLLTAAAFGGCKKDVVLKTLDVTLKTQLPMTVAATAPLTGTWSQELDPDGNADVRDNRNKIKKVVVERLSFKVLDFDGTTGTLASGTWRIHPADAPSEVLAVATISNLDLAARHADKQVQDLPLSEEAKNKIVDLINNKRKLTLVFEGAVTQRPVYAEYEISIATKIEVGL